MGLKIKDIIGIGLIVLVSLLLRSYKISNPVADWHSWRQADTAAVTRNYLKYGINLFYPRYDDLSDVSGTGAFNPNGYRFVEFPIFNILHFSLVKISPIGTLEQIGRFTSALAATVSAVLLFFLARRRSGYLVGFLSGFFYAVLPFNIYFTRVILPDPLMVTLFLASLNFYDIWNDKNKKIYLFLTAFFGACAVLVKPVAIFFLLPITLLQLGKLKKNIFSSFEFYFLHIMFIAPFGLWRIWSYRHPEGIPASGWLLNGNGIRFKPSFFEWLFGTRIGTLILGKWGIWQFMTGLITSGKYGLYMGISSFVYLSVVATGNVHHDYYQIPILPSIAMLLAIGTHKLLQPSTTGFRWLFKSSAVVVCTLFMLAFSWYDIRGLYQVNNWSIVNAGKAADKIIPSEAVVIAPYQGDTAFLYQTNRSGFAYLYKPLKDLIDKYHVSYYISVNYDDDTNEIMNKYTVIQKTPEFVIVKLEEQLKPIQ